MAPQHGLALPSPILPAIDAAACAWELALERVCSAQCLEHHYDRVRGVCAEMGVALCTELAQAADQIASSACLKPLEQRRLVAALRACA